MIRIKGTNIKLEIMKEATIQTLHPESGKRNKRISVEKYEIIKAAILEILQYLTPTHSELMEELAAKLKNNFQDNVNWYGTTVKLDLEARKILVRTSSKPQRYRVK